MKPIPRRNFLKRMAAASFGLPSLLHIPKFLSSKPRYREQYDAWLEINLDNIAWNLAQIRQRVGNHPVMAVIKANAYGHGLVEIGKFLEKQKIHSLAVGKFQEAMKLREEGVRTPVLNFGMFSREQAEDLVRRNISQSVFTDDFIYLAEAARKYNTTAKIHIKIDTGLGRIGIPYYQALPLIEKIAATEGIRIAGIFTPFTENDVFDKTQLSRFLEVCEAANKKGVDIGLRHAASSAGVISFPDGYLDMVRPGIAIYGQYPSTREYEARNIDLRPAMSLKARVMYLKTLRPGDSVSYHRTFVAEKETHVATISVGYSDGYPHQAAQKAEVLLAGKRWPTIALVTSNHATANTTGAANIQIGDEVVLFGRQGNGEISAEELAAWAGTSVYKILIGMNPLLPRKIVVG